MQPTILSQLPSLAYGGDYNPEQWPEATWREDAELMQQAGVNLVSLGVFAWAYLEPRPGEYDFGWLDRVIELLHAHNVKINLATATASPPPWLARLHPESLPITADGTRLWPGSRQQYCPHSKAYRERAAALVERLAERYRDHPALAMWHVNNEYACHVAECFCDESAAAFRAWLQRRYSSIEALNEAWGTAFWSQRYDAWEEISPPRSAPTFINPTQQLDWQRFSSDSLLECFDMERAILKRMTPDVPVTTNFMGFFKPLDYWAWAAREDVVAHDCYPDPRDRDSIVAAAMSYDLMRSLRSGQPWILMEQVTSQVQWRPRNPLKRPGQMRLLSYQAVARGADGVMFFQWRASLAGAEKFHGAMLPHTGTESRVWREVTELGSELARLAALRDTRVPAEVAILFDWHSWWALELECRPSSDIRMRHQLQAYYDVLFRRNIAVDFVQPGRDLSGYRAVLVPNLYLADEQVAGSLERFVGGGGTLVMSPLSGIADASDHIYPGGYPAPFRKLLGLRIEEFDPYPLDHANHLITADGERFETWLWSDIIALEGAQSIASYGADFYAGRPAIARHALGQGQSYYLGTCLGPHGMAWLLDRALGEAGVRPPVEVPEGVEVGQRAGPRQRFTFVLNYNDQAIEIRLPAPAHDLLGGQMNAETLTLGAFDAAILADADGDGA
ncbi:MAG TPA: beta-galactosidase [Roseiflexaceae bacterium]|nr:beta-galactosidase [Roseiflexaceae bacterium]